MKPPQHNLLAAAYTAFNRRYIEAALAAMHPKVEGPNAMEGGTLRGRDAVRATGPANGG